MIIFVIQIAKISVVNSSAWACRKTSHPIVLFSVLTFSFPLNHSVIVTGIGFLFTFALVISLVIKLTVRRSKAMMRFFLWHFLLPVLVINFHSIKRVEGSWKRSIRSRIGIFQTSFPVLLSLFFMFINPKLMVSSFLFQMRDIIMREIASWSWGCSWKKFSVFVEKSFRFNWTFSLFR